MKNKIQTVLLLILVLLGGCKQQKQKSTQVRSTHLEVRKTVDLYAVNPENKQILLDQLRSFLNAIPLGFEKKYGFEKRADFKRAKWGHSYPMATLSFQNEKLPRLEWLMMMRISITVEGQAKMWATAIKKKEKWQLVNIGAVILAKEYEKLEENLKPNAFYKRALLRIYPLRSDFLLFYKQTPSKLEPMAIFPNRSAQKFLQFSPNILPFSAFLQSIQERWKKSAAQRGANK